MEYIKGETLKDKINREGTLPLDLTLKIVQEIAGALENAHANHLVHCDIKPHNILINEAGHVKVADFGIARATSSSTITYTGSIVGSVHYFSPEQAKGHIISPKSDIYSLGVVMYEMLTGKVPFTGETAVSIAIKHLQEAPIAPHELRSDIPPLIEAIVLKAMDKNPDNRFSSTELIKEIDQVKHKPFAKVNILTEDPFATRVLTADEIEQLQKVNIEPTKSEVKPTYTVPIQNKGHSGIVKQSSSSFFSKKFVISLVVILILGFTVGTFLAYGDLGNSKTVTVPNVVSMSQAQAEETLKAENLRVEIAETFDESVPVGKVASQTPEAGKNVKENRLVTIYISKGGEEVNMINLVGMTKTEAESQLTKLKIKVGQVISEYSDKPAGTILQQSIKANDKVKKGASVDIVVSKGKEIKKVAVPNVIGQPVDTAKASLETQGFKVKVSALSGSVTAQSIPAGSQMDAGSLIELTVSDNVADKNINTQNNKADKHELTNAKEANSAGEKATVEVPQRQRN